MPVNALHKTRLTLGRFSRERTAAVPEGRTPAHDLRKTRRSRFNAWPVAGGKLLCAFAHMPQQLHNNVATSKNIFSGHFQFSTPAALCYHHSMKSLTEHLWFEVPGRRGFVNVTDTVAELVRKSGVTEGLCLVNAMHITASVFINDAEDGLLHDYDVWLEKLAPHAPTSQYRHNRTGEDNADAHMKRQIMGREVVVAITKGKLDFGPWEQIFYGEFDGRRRKRALVKIIGE
jgi:secondary thiamine-phosphate synthase enzyme